MSNVSRVFGAMETSLSALQAQRQRMDVIASNMANAESTRTPAGGPYKRQQVVFEAVLNDAKAQIEGTGSGEGSGTGVKVSSVVSDKRPPLVVNIPGHPDADANGNVRMPDIRPAEEMADLISAARSYEANAAAMRISRNLFQRSLDLGKA